jgi:hypothetical protein
MTRGFLFVKNVMLLFIFLKISFLLAADGLVLIRKFEGLLKE